MIWPISETEEENISSWGMDLLLKPQWSKVNQKSTEAISKPDGCFSKIPSWEGFWNPLMLLDLQVPHAKTIQLHEPIILLVLPNTSYCPDHAGGKTQYFCACRFVSIPSDQNIIRFQRLWIHNICTSKTSFYSCVSGSTWDVSVPLSFHPWLKQ